MERKDQVVSITPIPFEPLRYWVQSDSRTDVLHVVDLAWQEEPRQRCKPFCSCERCLAQHEATCKHIAACVRWEKLRLSL